MIDPTCEIGGMLSVAESYLRGLNPDARPKVFEQVVNDELCAICKSDMHIKRHEVDNIKRRNSPSNNQVGGVRADYLIVNPAGSGTTRSPSRLSRRALANMLSSRPDAPRER